MGIGIDILSKQAEAPFTVNNFIAVCIVTELLNLLSLGRYADSNHINHSFLVYEGVFLFFCVKLQLSCSFVTAAATLCGLLLYDVIWVFGSPYVFGDNVMVSVSSSLENTNKQRNAQSWLKNI